MTCDLGHGHGSGLALLSLWGLLADAALIPPTGWELPGAVGVALRGFKIIQKICTTLARNQSHHGTDNTRS